MPTGWEKRNSSVQLSECRGFVSVAYKCFSSFACRFVNVFINKKLKKNKKRKKRFYIYGSCLLVFEILAVRP